MIAALALAHGWLLGVAVVDARIRRIPGPLTLAGLGVAAAVAWAGGAWWPALAGGAGLGAVYLVLRLISPGSLGGGDLKAAPAVGALAAVGAGTAGWLLAAVLPFLVTAVLGIVLRLARGDSHVPHGPGMCLAAALAVTPLW